MKKIKEIGSYLLGAIVVLGVVSIPIMFIKGSLWVFEVFYPFLEKISNIGWIVIVALLLVSIFPKARGFAGAGIFFASYLWGAVLWLTSLAIAYSLWGWLGILIGVFLAGYGVFVVAIAALVLSGQLLTAFFMLVSLGLVYGARILGLSMADKYEDRRREREFERNSFLEAETVSEDKE